MVDVSVIIPIYKGKKYLAYWMDILSQNFKNYQKEYESSCEAIFVNDYPEETIEFPNLEPHIKIWNLNTNRGIHGARVFGYEKAEGSYVVFLDQDDKIAENYLVSQMKSIGGSDAVVCNGHRDRLWMQGRRAIYTRDEQMQRIKDDKNFFIKENEIRSPGQVLMKKEAVPDLWLSEIMRENGADDYLLWILMRKGNRTFEINPQRLYIHMEYGSNTSNQDEGMKRSILEMISILEKNHVLMNQELVEIRKRADQGID